MDVRIDSGIEIKTIKVDRHEPRNSRIIRPVRLAAIAPSRRTAAIDAVTSFDWSNSSLMLRPGGAAARATSRTFRTPLTTAAVVDLADVPQEYRLPVNVFDRNIVEVRGAYGHRVGAHRVLRIANLGETRRQGEILSIDGVHHVRRCQAS